MAHHQHTILIHFSNKLDNMGVLDVNLGFDAGGPCKCGKHFELCYTTDDDGVHVRERT